jgi:hypothetical protein
MITAPSTKADEGRKQDRKIEDRKMADASQSANRSSRKGAKPQRQTTGLEMNPLRLCAFA